MDELGGWGMACGGDATFFSGSWYTPLHGRHVAMHGLISCHSLGSCRTWIATAFFFCPSCVLAARRVALFCEALVPSMEQQGGGSGRLMECMRAMRQGGIRRSV